METEIPISLTAPLSLTDLLINLGVGALLAFVVRWHYCRFGSALSNREELGKVFPLIILTTVLIITIVKSSLALSLGLVGALSIVRFRTPIKEPEELAYLFISIAIGLGLGASQTIPTLVAVSMILAVVGGFKARRRESVSKRMYLSIDWSTDNQSEAPQLQALNELISNHVTTCDLRRLDRRSGAFDATYFVDIKDVTEVSGLTDEISQKYSNVGVTFIDQTDMPSV